ncbi:MAG: GNAT family N-acetyltransferase [bacterium]|nr:GNAT family N-acetyltransferase [bacterium]MBK8127381.1 GNAT family N-acetyltransferase [bacterium]
MIVSTAKIADLPQLLELIAEYQADGEEFEALAEDINTEYLREILENDRLGHVIIGYTSSGVPVGFLLMYLTPSTLEAQRIPTILDLFVRVNQREKGFGRQLFDHAIRWAKKHKYTHIDCTVETMNMVAQYLFDYYKAESAGRVYYSIDLTKE